MWAEVNLPPPPRPAPSVFTGGIAERGGWHASGPFARLEVGDDLLVIRATRLATVVGLHDVQAQKAETKAVRLSTGVLAVRVSVIRADGVELEPYFTAMSRGPIRRALLARGWPVVEDKWRFGLRSPDEPVP